MAGVPVDAKQAAVEQWTADPCGARVARHRPGSREYLETLLAGREEYAPWMAEALDYAGGAGRHVLDVGCGQGIDLVHFARAGARVTGVDLTPRHVRLARDHLATAGLIGEVFEGDAEALPFADATFDRASSNGVLHHTPDMPAALREIRRVLRPGGEARIVVYNRSSYHYWLHQVAWRGVLRGDLVRERSMVGVLSRNVEQSSIGARPLVRVYSPRQLRRLMSAAGFVEVRTSMRHYNPDSTPITQALQRLGVKAVERPALLDHLGRTGGWYVVARGARAAS